MQLAFEKIRELRSLGYRVEPVALSPTVCDFRPWPIREAA